MKNTISAIPPNDPSSPTPPTAPVESSQNVGLPESSNSQAKAAFGAAPLLGDNFKPQIYPTQRDAKPIVLDLSVPLSERNESHQKLAKSLLSLDQPIPLVIVKGLSETQRKTVESFAESLSFEDAEESLKTLRRLIFEPILLTEVS